MKHQQRKRKYQATRKRSSDGFTLIEALVAGLVVAAVMTAVGRLSVSAMATSKPIHKKPDRSRHQRPHSTPTDAGLYLTQEAITSLEGLNTTMDAACQAPSTFLKTISHNPISQASSTTIKSTYWDDTNPYLLIVTYSFEAPEKSIGQEKRITELNPNFSSQCYDLQ